MEPYTLNAKGNIRAQNVTDVDRQLEAMLLPARERLKKYSVEEICLKAGVQFDEESQCIFFDSLGQTIHIHVPDYVILEELDMWHHLTLLQYLDTADGTNLTENWIGLQQLSGGLSRGWSFDRDISAIIEHDMKSVTPDEFQAICECLGGVKIAGKADVSMKIDYASRFPIVVNFWEADDEFPASGKVLVNENAEHYLTIEAAGGACTAVIRRVAENMPDDYT